MRQKSNPGEREGDMDRGLRCMSTGLVRPPWHGPALCGRQAWEESECHTAKAFGCLTRVSVASEKQVLRARAEDTEGRRLKFRRSSRRRQCALRGAAQTFLGCIQGHVVTRSPAAFCRPSGLNVACRASSGDSSPRCDELGVSFWRSYPNIQQLSQGGRS